jgi:hypothetical protein
MADRIAAGILAVCCLLAPRSLLAQGRDAGSPAAPTAAEGRSLEERIEALERTRESYEEAIREQGRLARRVEELEREKAEREATAAREKERLERRVEELETAQVAHEDATRSIIAQSLVGLGSKINEFVDLGGVLEVLPGWEEDFLGDDLQSISLQTAELQLEIQVTDWARGSLVLEYDAAQDAVFTTTEGDELSVDKINVDTAFVTLGDTERFPAYARLGRMVVPFGISTGDPVADVLSIVDPLTVEVFETKADAILFGAEFPTPTPTPEALIAAPPAVKPLVVAPLVAGLVRRLGYRPFPAPPPSPAFVPRPPARPPFSAGVYFYDGEAFEKFSRQGEWDLRHHMGAMAGYRTQGTCRSHLDTTVSPDEAHWLQVLCPWTLDLGVEWNRSVFDSDFLASDYRVFIAGDPDTGRSPIGFVPGMATSMKATLGPVSLVAEWNGALESADFIDDDPVSLIPRRQDKRPRAWQVSLGYQFGWNPAVETIGAQGTYLAASYSASQDLGGAVRINTQDFTSARVGFVPRRRITVGAGEWVLPNLRLALEYARAWDYSKGHGGTNEVADAVLSMLTFEW